MERAPHLSSTLTGYEQVRSIVSALTGGLGSRPPGRTGAAGKRASARRMLAARGAVPADARGNETR